MLSGIIFIIRSGLRWHDAPATFGTLTTLDNRRKRWSDKDAFARIMVGLAAEHGEQKTVLIPSHRNCVWTAGAVDASYLKAHRTATSMGVKKGSVDA